MSQAALKQGSHATKFTFSRSWTAPQTVLKLSAGLPVLLIIEYLFADGDLAKEELLIGLPVLRHLGLDARTLLEYLRDLLDATDCLGVTTHNCHGRVGKPMIARQNRISTEPSNNEKIDSRYRNRTNFS